MSKNNNVKGLMERLNEVKIALLQTETKKGVYSFETLQLKKQEVHIMEQILLLSK